MAYARMLHRTIAIDSRFNKLTIKEQWGFMRLLPFADDEGKLPGNITELRALTMPLAPIRDGELEKLLESIEDVGLIRWNRDSVIEYAGWKKNQKIKGQDYEGFYQKIGNRPKKSFLPDYVKEERKPKPAIEPKIKVKVSSSELSRDFLREMVDKFPDKDVPKAYESWLDYLKSSGKSYKDYEAAFRNVLRREWTPAKNGGPTSKFRRAPSGLIIGYCRKCDAQLFFEHEWQAEKASHCGRGLTGKEEEYGN